MHLKVLFDNHVLRRWHVALVERLARRPDCIVTVERLPSRHGLSTNAERLFQANALIHGLARPGLATRAEPDALARYGSQAAGPVDLILDLCGQDRIGDAPVWTLAFDGLLGEAGLLASLMSGRAPVATISDGSTVIATGRLGTERPGIALASFEDCLARTMTLIVAALDGAASTSLPSQEVDEMPARTPALGLMDVGRKAAKDTVSAMIRRGYYSLYHAPHWRIGWRRVAGPDVVDLRRHPDGGWIDLPDDGRRFYADPFPFEHNGTVTLFVEEFDHRLKKGIISAAAFGPDGLIGRLEPVLELPYHLSYPFVFEEDGAIWMIPESCAAGTIDLYRATDYPRGWVHERTLVGGLVAGDATLVKHEGQWWMFASVQDGGGAYSDNLHVWSAPGFRGPWTPHRRNPVLIDIASARPAGRVVSRGGALIRPVQDCRKGYGNALGLARIVKLDHDGFEQVVETTLHAGDVWPGRRIHTLNAAGGYEFIDGSGHARRRLWDRW